MLFERLMDRDVGNNERFRKFHDRSFPDLLIELFTGKADGLSLVVGHDESGFYTSDNWAHIPSSRSKTALSSRDGRFADGNLMAAFQCEVRARPVQFARERERMP